MARSLSDGRSREKPSKHISHDKNSLTRGLTKPSLEHLKPASPPKTNPWTTRRPTTTLFPDWPSITPDFATVSGQGDKNEALPVKDEAAPKQNQHDSWPSDGKESDTSSSSRTELQQPTPRGGKRCVDEIVSYQVFFSLQAGGLNKPTVYGFAPLAPMFLFELVPRSSKYTVVSWNLNRPFSNNTFRPGEI